MTDLETAARDACHIWRAFSTDANGVCADKPDDVYIEAFLAGAAHMQNKENELTQIIKWRDESIEELRQSIINERKRIEELEAHAKLHEKHLQLFEESIRHSFKEREDHLTDQLTKEREISKMLEEALRFECGNRCAEQNPCNAKEALAEVQKLRGV